VRLSVSDEDQDRYGRLLRYVNIGNMDAGLRQIKRGFAIARYDALDTLTAWAGRWYCAASVTLVVEPAVGEDRPTPATAMVTTRASPSTSRRTTQVGRSRARSRGPSPSQGAVGWR
jgi:hypothetical protein